MSSNTFAVCHTEELIYVHIDKEQRDFDALLHAYVLCEELLKPNPLTRFLITYLAVRRERALQSFVGRDDKGFNLEEYLEPHVLPWSLVISQMLSFVSQSNC